jgi:hypothetical protein
MVGVVHPRVGRGLVKHPVLAPLLGGTIAGAVMAADTPTDWSFVAITIAVMTTVVCSPSVENRLASLRERGPGAAVPPLPPRRRRARQRVRSHLRAHALRLLSLRVRARRRPGRGVLGTRLPLADGQPATGPPLVEGQAAGPRVSAVTHDRLGAPQVPFSVAPRTAKGSCPDLLGWIFGRLPWGSWCSCQTLVGRSGETPSLGHFGP